MFSDLFLTIFRICTLPFEFDYEVSLARTYLNCWTAEVKAAIFVLFCDFWGIFQSFIIDYVINHEVFKNQLSSVAQSCPIFCDPMYRNTPGLPVHHKLPEFTQTYVNWVGDAHPTISSSVIPFSSCPQSFPASGSFQIVSFSYQVAKVLEFQLQHQSFQWTPRTDLL